jgi:alpha-beta hydrolase superfamily lysophospholipase
MDAAMTSIFDDARFIRNLFFPRRVASRPPLGARDLWIDAADGVRLHARIHEGPRSLAKVLLFHGNGETVADYDEFVSQFWGAKADLAVVDYRGYGQSDGSPSLRSCLADAHAAARAILADGRRELPLLVMGRSLGSACAAELASHSARFELQGIIFESGFTDLYDFIRRRGLRPPAQLPEEDLVAYCPLRKLASSDVPLLVLHGSHDELIPATDGKAAYDSAKALDKRLVLIPGAGHNDLMFHPLYWESIARFVSDVANRAH